MSETYAKDRHRGYFEHKPIENSDPASFVATPDLNFARDRTHVYALGESAEACDPKSFRLLQERWQVDSQCAYSVMRPEPRLLPSSCSISVF